MKVCTSFDTAFCIGDSQEELFYLTKEKMSEKSV